MEPDRSSLTPIQSTESTNPPVKKQSFFCDRCGSEMFALQCKIICPNCGSRFDCSDINIHFD